MIPDLDIIRAAQVVIREHGDAAELIAAGRVDDLLEIGDTEGQAVWLRILEAVKDLQRTAPGDGERLN